jgi:hypothetical protein
MRVDADQTRDCRVALSVRHEHRDIRGVQDGAGTAAEDELTRGEHISRHRRPASTAGAPSEAAEEPDPDPERLILGGNAKWLFKLG